MGAKSKPIATQKAGKGKNQNSAGNGAALKKKKQQRVATDALSQQTADVIGKAIGSRNAKEAALQTLTDSAGSTTDLRDSLASLYKLAASSCFHSAKCRPLKVGKVIPRFPISTVVTNKDQVSVEQLWGQLNVVFTPVLKTLQGALEADSEGVNAAIASSKRGGNRKNASYGDDDDEDDEEEEVDEDLFAALAADRGEDDEEEEEMTFGENDGPKKKNPKKKEVAEKDKWKYAFGVGNDAFDDDEEEEEDDEYGESRADRRRNAVNEGYGDEEKGGPGGDEEEEENYPDTGDFDPYGELPTGGGGGEDGEDDDEDELAMKELYGDDADYDEEDMPFGGQDEGEDDMDDLELLDEDGNAEEAAQREKKGGGVRQQYGDDEEEGWGNAYGDEEEEEEGDVLDGDAYDFDDDGKALAALSRRKKVRFDENGEPQDPTATMGGGGAAEIDESELEGLSTHQRNELKRQRSTQDLEESRLFGKDWTMMGEAAGKDRGRDVLLDEKLEFDHAMRQVPTITEQVTSKLEARIKKRIMDNHFDDVERRSTKTMASDLTTSKRDEGIDAQKSKHSLMDLYEKDYLDKQKKAEDAESSGAAAANAEPLTEIEKDELKAIAQWKRLSQHLDALSNFFYTPKPVQEEVTARVRAVEGHAPAIALEAVGVLGVQSKESAIAPQDLFRAHKDKFVGVSKQEMDPTEKQALRRAKKTAGMAKKERMEQSKAAKVTTKRRDGEKAKILEDEAK